MSFFSVTSSAGAASDLASLLAAFWSAFFSAFWSAFFVAFFAAAFLLLFLAADFFSDLAAVCSSDFSSAAFGLPADCFSFAADSSPVGLVAADPSLSEASSG